jgi:hypothetical protein
VQDRRVAVAPLFATRGVESPDSLGESATAIYATPITSPLRGYLCRLPAVAFAAENRSSCPEYDAALIAKGSRVARIARAASRRRADYRRRRMVPGCDIRTGSSRQSGPRYRDANYVWLKVNWSGKSQRRVSQSYPAIRGCPHLFVSFQRTFAAVAGHGGAEAENYDPAAMRAFLVKWAPR